MMRFRSSCLITILVYLSGILHAADDDLLIADFEGDAYAPWVATGEAFGPGPAHGPLPGQMLVSGFQGQGLVNSYWNGDATRGTLTSHAFAIQRPYICFLIGGGNNDKELVLQLLIDGRVVRTATGTNSQPGGSEELTQESWDVREWMGKQAEIRILDDATGGWGHINVDHIVQSKQRPAGLLTNASRTLLVKQRYLHIPIKNGAPKRVVSLIVDGATIVRNDIELAPGQPDWWAAMDISPWRGQDVTLQVDQLPEDSTALSSIDQGDMLKDAEQLYTEPLRSQFHFSPRRGWNNDPNGLVYYNGEYHLFFQHNPYGWAWGNMHWGHAVSRDMVHWEELGDTLWPDNLGPMFSGSAVVDWNNTSGLGNDGKPPLVLIYTAAGNPAVQCIAHSTDGRTFTKFKGNPILPQITGGNRDPKVLWHEPSKRWVMVLYVEKPAGQHTIHFYTSPNLRDWDLASVMQGDKAGGRYLFECPHLFELPVDDDPSKTHWVLLGADSQYAIGSFDGRTFQPEAERLAGHHGRGFYAAQSFSDIPKQDGRRVLIGWFQTDTPGMPFNQSMTIPLELKLKSTQQGPRMTFAPIRELESLRASHVHIGPMAIKSDSTNPLSDIDAELIELRMVMEPGTSTRLLMKIRGAEIIYDATSQELSVNGQRAPAPLMDGKQQLIVYCDRAGVEVFASDGRCYVPMPFIPSALDRSIQIVSEGGATQIESIDFYELESSWQRE